MKLTLAALAALGLSATMAQAGDYPEKPIEVIVGYSAGGQIGFTEVAAAKPDGYSLGTFNLPATLALTYDRVADYDVDSYTYLANFVEDPNTITVAASSPFHTLDEMLDAAKADPGAITVGLSSLGGDDPFSANMMAAASGAEFTLVPFKGASNARTAIMGGHVAAGTMTLGQTTNFPDELRVLAVLDDERSPFRPDVPTAKELGYDVRMSSLRGIVAPAGLEGDVAETLLNALIAVNATPEFQAMMAEQDVVLLGGYRYHAQTIFATFEIDDLSDLEGHKIRVTSPEQGKFIETFGGTAITLSGSEVPTSLERGVIEGVLTASAGGAKRWAEFLPYNYRFPVNYGNSMIIDNADAFAELSPESQQALRDIVAKVGPETTAAFLEDEEVQKAKQAKACMTLVALADGDLDKVREMLAPFWEAIGK